MAIVEIPVWMTLDYDDSTYPGNMTCRPAGTLSRTRVEVGSLVVRWLDQRVCENVDGVSSAASGT